VNIKNGIKIMVRRLVLVTNERFAHNQNMKWIREPVSIIACAITKPEPLTTYVKRYELMESKR